MLLVVVGLVTAGAYVPRLHLRLADELQRTVAVTALAMLSVTAVAVLATRRTGVGDTMAVEWLLATTLVCAGRASVFTAQRWARAHAAAGSPTLIVGAGLVGHVAAKRLLAERQLGLQPVGFLDKEPLLDEQERTRRGLPHLPVLGASWDLERVVEEHGIEEVVVTFSSAPHTVLLELVRRCWRLGVSVLVVPRLYEIEGRRTHVEHVGALPLIALGTSDPLSWQFRVKYALDRVVAALLLLAVAPIFALVALAVRVRLGRPVLFRQQRVGRDGELFEMLKFRTMRGTPEEAGEANAAWAARVIAGEPAVWSAPQFPLDRRTPFGDFLRRLSLDELPQLWNVVRGDMSLIGPRPELPGYVERFDTAVYRYPDRHRVKSGLTGWAQVNGLRGETSLADRIEWDNFYIENWSPWLDLKILCRTLPAVLRRRGAQ
jgi:exopolysaccharide biosynthesis polyprenyl glycosylphosphotransferase